MNKLKIIFIILSVVLLCTYANHLDLSYSKDSIQIRESTLRNSDEWPQLKTNSQIELLCPTIAILDTGVNFNNQFLQKSKLVEIDISSNSNEYSHGTKIAGIIASDSREYKGILPKAKIISIKLGDENGWDEEKLIKGIKLAIQFKPNVINISSGIKTDNINLKKAIQEATKKNILVVASAGNDHQEDCEFPAAYPEVLSVGAIDKNYNISSMSNYGDKVKIFAPGEDIITIDTDSKGNKTTNICRINGTSAAAPFVTCLAAAIMVKNPSLSPEKTMEIILNSADINKSDKNYTYRIINYKKALNPIENIKERNN